MRKLLGVGLKLGVSYVVGSIIYQLGMRYGATHPNAWSKETGA